MILQSLAVPYQQWQPLPAATLLLVILLPLLSIVFAATSIWRRRRSTSRASRLPLGPRGLPILGNLHQMGALPHRGLRELARRHGPVMMLRLGTVPTAVVSSAEAARDVLKTHDADCCSRSDTPGPRRLSYEHNVVAFSPYSERWRERRRLLVAEFLSKRRIQDTWHAREAEVEKLIGGLTAAASSGAAMALEEHVFGYMDGIVGTVAFGNIYGAEHFAYRKERFHRVC